jgi:hypothetical protein
MTDGNEQQKRAGAYFLFGLGAPIAAAFIYPFIGGRRGHRLIEWEALSAQQLTVFIVGAAVGIAMLIAGGIILRRL